MKVAVVTDDNKTISPHFGRAQYYLVYEISNGRTVLSKETRAKASHSHREAVQLLHDSLKTGATLESDHHNDAATEATLHDTMLSNVRDCEALIARGMGAGMYGSIRHLGIKPFVTDIVTADDAVQAYIKGTLDNHVERLH
ncbi:MAG: dinitrogenase iron-molybdenum cofactor biosynthesis protein [Nitrososphaerota archaeon]|nr:dinitrogenase iron-molybdenum cofactor biosynthesis protein [Nitrososphaerota archaeon]